MTDETQTQAMAPAGAPRFRPAAGSMALLGVTPFFIFAVMFLILPTGFLVVGAFQTNEGGFTLQNLANLFQPTILNAYWISIRISVASSLVGALIGFIL